MNTRLSRYQSQTYKEEQDYENGFGRHYRHKIIPHLNAAEAEQSKLSATIRGRIYGVGALLVIISAASTYAEIQFDRALSGFFLGLSNNTSFFFATCVIVLLYGLFKFIDAPRNAFQDDLKLILIPKILEFFGDFSYEPSGHVSTKVLNASLFPGRSETNFGDRITGEHAGMAFDLFETDMWQHRNKRSLINVFDGIVVVVAIPMIKGRTVVVPSKGKPEDWSPFTGKESSGLERIRLGNGKINDAFSVFSTDREAAERLITNDLVEMVNHVNAMLDGSKTEFAFLGKSFVLKISTSRDFFELNASPEQSFSVSSVKKFVAETYYFLQIVNLIGEVIRNLEPEFKNIAPDNFTDDVVANKDGTFSVHGRTYKSRSSAEAYLDHFG